MEVWGLYNLKQETSLLVEPSRKLRKDQDTILESGGKGDGKNKDHLTIILLEELISISL